MLFLLSETIGVTLWTVFPILPFSRAADDEQIGSVFLAAGMLLYVLCGLIAIGVIHVLYRWTVAYFAVAIWLFFLRSYLLRKRCPADSS